MSRRRGRRGCVGGIVRWRFVAGVFPCRDQLETRQLLLVLCRRECNRRATVIGIWSRCLDIEIRRGVGLEK